MSRTANSDVINTLETAANAGAPLLVELRDGRRFADGVCELLRQYGEDFVVFHANNRIVVGDITHAELLALQDDDVESCSAA